MLRRCGVCFLALIWAGWIVTSASRAVAAEFKVPTLTGPVIDQAGFLTREDRKQLSQLLYDFNRLGKAQVQVLVLKDLQGFEIEPAAIKIAEQWKLGDAQRDNGVLFLVAAQERKLRIEVGQGLEGAIPDITAKRIISDQVLPLFRSSRASAGIVVGVHEILRLADAEFADANIAPNQAKGGKIPIGIVVLLFIIISVLGRFGGGRGGRNFRNAGWGGGGGFGGGGFGGSGGGGWSGGGGGFSGGGASGSW